MIPVAAGVRIWIATGHTDMRNYVERRIMRSPGRFTLHWLGLLGCSTPHNFRPHLSLSIASNLSGGRKRPGLRFGAAAALRASSFSDGSARR